MRGPASRAALPWLLAEASLVARYLLPCRAIAVGEAGMELEGLPGARKLDKCPEGKPEQPSVRDNQSSIALLSR